MRPRCRTACLKDQGFTKVSVVARFTVLQVAKVKLVPASPGLASRVRSGPPPKCRRRIARSSSARMRCGYIASGLVKERVTAKLMMDDRPPRDVRD